MGFDPVTAADRAAEVTMRSLIESSFRSTALSARNSQRAHRCRICLGARPDRRHQVVHFRNAGLGLADRALAERQTDLRDDAPAFIREHSRVTAARHAIADRRASANFMYAPARFGGRDAVHHQPATDECGRSRSIRRVEAAVRLSRYGGDCYPYCMLAAGQSIL